MTDITELALITKIKNQLKNFDTVVLREAEANALVEALEKAQQRIAELESRSVTVKLPTTRLWAGVTDCYEKSDVIAAIRAAGVEVSDD